MSYSQKSEMESKYMYAIRLLFARSMEQIAKYVNASNGITSANSSRKGWAQCVIAYTDSHLSHNFIQDFCLIYTIFISEHDKKTRINFITTCENLK